MTQIILPEFIEFPASKISLSIRKPVYGVGINDADYVTHIIISKERVYCPYYATWKSMLMRCYSAKYQVKRPTYAGCSVTPEWLNFMTFRSWMVRQDWQGKQLDKDIQFPGNKIYGPNTCVFVSMEINNLLCGRASARGKYPQGVCFDKQTGKFLSSMTTGGKSKHIGRFDTPRAASAAYRKTKRLLIIATALTQTDARIRRGLMLHSKLFAEGPA